jgi:hypothetical protein
MLDIKAWEEGYGKNARFHAGDADGLSGSTVTWNQHSARTLSGEGEQRREV